jgi:hypothetical protein
LNQLPPDEPYAWLGRVGTLSTILVVAWAVIRGYFALVSRKELSERLEQITKAQAERDEAAEKISAARHEENLQNFREIFGRIGDVEVSVGEVRGELRARFGGGA